MSFIKEFKDFAMRGNLIDMAVGIVIGAAFGTVTAAFTSGIFMPLVGTVFQVGDLNEYAYDLSKLTGAEKPNLLKIGSFISAIINFLIMAFAMFLIVKGMNSLKKKQEAAPPAAPPAPSNEEKLLAEIRDLLKK